MKVILSLISAIVLVSVNLAASEPPPIFIIKSGPAGRTIWNSYLLEDGRFDLKNYILDHLKLGSLHDGETETFLAWHLIQIDQDPKPVFDEMLESDDAITVSVALYTIGFLHDQRYLRQVEELIDSPLKLPSSWDYKTIKDQAESVRSNLQVELGVGDESANPISRTLANYQADWFKNRNLIRKESDNSL